MKTFKEYLTEGRKTYAFKIKVAGDLAEGFDEKLKSAIDRFATVNLTKGKRTPIQDVPLDFPTMKNTQVTIWDAEVSYPTTSEVLENYVSAITGHTLHCVKVVPINAASEEYQEQNGEKTDQVLLNQEQLEAVDAQDVVGEKGKMSLLKELEKLKHGGESYKGVNDQLLAASSPAEKSSEVPEGSTKSPIGSTKGK
jgi:hypothetical protein